MGATRMRSFLAPAAPFLLARPLALGLLAAVLIAGMPGDAPAGPSPLVRVDLVSESAGIASGAAVWVGIRQRIAEGWHTYWSNPGDSGEPLTVEWALPPGFTADAIVWPHPERIRVGPAMSHGYTGEAVLLVRVTAPPDLPPGRQVTLRGRASWLVCEKICIPEEADLALTLPVVAGRPAPAREAPLIARARRAVPVASPWPATVSASPERVVVSLAARGLAAERIADIWFYPARWGLIEHAAPQEASVDETGITLSMARGPLPAAAEGPVEGVLVVKERLDRETVSQAFTIRGDPAGAPAAAGSAAAPLSIAGAIGLALLGGLILNLMPCVLPVLSVKTLSLLRHADASAAAVRRHGLAHTAGVLACFIALAGVLLALRAGGAGIGWGFQLQSPLVVAALAYLFFALALSLSGALVVGGRLAGLGDSLAARPGYAGSFFTGALVAVAATPCTAPFMGVATGFALTQPAGIALAVFGALGLGLALPYLALSVAPAWRRLLPRPGPWMERLKQLLAFPLYATVAWLVWVVSEQAGPRGTAAVLTGLVLIAFGVWIHGVARAATPARRRLLAAAAVASVAAAIALGPLALGAPAPAPGPAAAGAVTWEPWSPRRVAEARAGGKAVFVNFTAAWCITCLVNERVALRSPAVAEAFARKGVVYLKADWTNRSPEIAAALEVFGRSGVPLYVLYPPRAAPTILAPVLTEGSILEAIESI
jgi:thiol:disulfide interchange protein